MAKAGGVNYGHGLIRIILICDSPPSVSSGLENEIGRLSKKFSIAHHRKSVRWRVF